MSYCIFSRTNGVPMNYIGTRSGRWLVIGEPKKKMYAHDIGTKCRCDCGTERIVAIRRILNGDTKSCGCAANEAAANKNRKHGQYKTKFYAVWRTMKERCHNPNHCGYSRYGDRGIYVCDRWQLFENFRDDNQAQYKNGLTLDRIKNDGPYSPENCRWVTPAEQATNRSNNVILEFNGERLTVSQWARKIGVQEITLRKRIRAGWAVDVALTKSIRRYN